MSLMRRSDAPQRGSGLHEKQLRRAPIPARAAQFD
jgi:hypothetical protein